LVADIVALTIQVGLDRLLHPARIRAPLRGAPALSTAQPGEKITAP
jgi:hypothetical protein